MLGLLVRGFFLLGIISWYSNGVFKFINDYFLNEYKSYLSDEFRRNKHLQLQTVTEIPTEPPPTSDLAPDNSHLSIVTGEVKTYDKDLCQSPNELDYHNQLPTSDRQSRDDDGFINYWLKRRSGDNSDNNLYCQQRATNCGHN